MFPLFPQIILKIGRGKVVSENKIILTIRQEE